MLETRIRILEINAVVRRASAERGALDALGSARHSPLKALVRSGKANCLPLQSAGKRNVGRRRFAQVSARLFIGARVHRFSLRVRGAFNRAEWKRTWAERRTPCVGWIYRANRQLWQPAKPGVLWLMLNPGTGVNLSLAVTIRKPPYLAGY